ncbi:MAG: alkaline phosphatase family protein, partial [Thermoleophilia bacterium]|nr:alkaline phosphatase family protein [Thermoleophilia bacterium]
DSDAWLKHGFDATSLGLTTGSPPGYYASQNSLVEPQPSRFSEWNREFQEMLKQDPTGDSVPAFSTVRLMRDHTMGLNPGNSSPSAMMADNDYAVGELVEAVSKSPIWESTVIFIVEDDAQFSNDHVDSHRSFAQVISPWIKKSTVDSRFYDTNSVLKSMELLLGLSPMSQYDHYANPILGGWDSNPGNNDVYTAILPPKDMIGEMNPGLGSYAPNSQLRRLAELSTTMNWSVADAAPYSLLNEILWKDARGAFATVPGLRSSSLNLPGQQREEQSDDDDD